MPLSEQEFRAWSYRDGGETYDRPNESGIAHRFPDEDSNDYVIRISKDGLRAHDRGCAAIIAHQFAFPRMD